MLASPWRRHSPWRRASALFLPCCCLSRRCRCGLGPRFCGARLSQQPSPPKCSRARLCNHTQLPLFSSVSLLAASQNPPPLFPPLGPAERVLRPLGGPPTHPSTPFARFPPPFISIPAAAAKTAPGRRRRRLQSFFPLLFCAARRSRMRESEREHAVFTPFVEACARPFFGHPSCPLPSRQTAKRGGQGGRECAFCPKRGGARNHARGTPCVCIVNGTIRLSNPSSFCVGWVEFGRGDGAADKSSSEERRRHHNGDESL